MQIQAPATAAALLTKLGRAYIPARTSASRLEDRYVEAVALELAKLGYAISPALRERLARRELAELVAIKDWMVAALAAQLGAHVEHVPLFRKFPDGVPDDTFQLWIRKVLVHFCQAPDQPCLFCGRVGTTHVLQPCMHVVCDACFDGSNYSACPSCEHAVDTTSPFFEPTPYTGGGTKPERVVYRRLDVGDDVAVGAREAFERLCARAQALSPDDRALVATILDDFGETVLAWIPAEIPLRENVALIFGTLLRAPDPDAVLAAAAAHLKTATDVLRTIAAYAGADPALQRERIFEEIEVLEHPSRWWGRIAALLGAAPPSAVTTTRRVPRYVHRFEVGRLPRRLRRALLRTLEGMAPDALVEDMLRHRSYWVWVGEFLHPHEYAKRFPNVARAFAIVRKKAPDGTKAPVFRTYYGKLEAAAEGGDAREMVRLLEQRPGELARRLDHVLRVAGDDDAAIDAVVDTFARLVTRMSTPVLATLSSLLPTRREPGGIRMYWPKGSVAIGISQPDTRPALAPRAIARATAAVDAELLRRFAAQPHFDTVVVDAALRDVVVPFNERTASASAVSLPRGSKIAVPEGETLRMFLHWCEPKTKGRTTDLDLSVAFFDEAWAYVSVCSFYSLKLAHRGHDVAVSSGDLRSAPHPNGATEFVDVDRAAARAAGLRWAVMVVNAYGGMSFGELERAFAGLMLRDEVRAETFDPRTVQLKFQLAGEHGVFMPLVVDLYDDELHWLDTYSKGGFAYNTVESSKRALGKICPDMIEYFGQGGRMSMLELSLRHAAARGRRVVVRDGDATRTFVRRADEASADFLARLRGATPDAQGPVAAEDTPWLALLYRGDLVVPAGSEIYALFREQLVPTISASDLVVAAPGA